jgi:hypothetical protein
MKEEKDLVAGHLEELKAFRDNRVAARFEVVADRGRLLSLCAANDPWIEVRWIDDERLQLDLIALKASSPVPGTWEQKSDSRWIVPVSETDGLSEWINGEWNRARGKTSKRLRMWTE